MTTMPASVPMLRRINFRILILIALVLLPVGFVMWQFLRPNVIERGGVKEVDMYWLSNFEIDPDIATDADIPADRRKLDGAHVLLRGEMWRADAWQGPVTQFDLVYSIQKCCMVGRPKIQHFVKSHVLPNARANAYEGLVDVTGTLHVGMIRDKTSNKLLSVYRLDVQSVKPVK